MRPSKMTSFRIASISTHLSVPMTPVLLRLTQKTALFGVEAPSGTGLEWMTVAALVVPAILLVVLVYVGQKQTI